MHQSEKYIPALSYDLLTPLYDPLLRWFMRESAFKRRLITQADIREGHRVLDLGRGTGKPYARLIAALTARSEEAPLKIQGLLPEMFRVAGFERVEETGRIMTAAGTLSFYKARKSNG